jgi:hypothetical protein
VCRNCGLPVARPTDPLRGVTPGRLDIPGMRNSGISATVGLAVVIGVLLVAGTLALSGGGILSRGGLLGGGPANASPASLAPGQTPVPGSSPDPGAPQAGAPNDNTAFSCSTLSVRDPERARWRFNQVEALALDGFEQIVISLERAGGRAREAGTASTAWLTPEEAIERYQIPRPAGSRTVVLTFDAPVELDSSRSLDDSALEGLGLQNVRSVHVAEADGQLVAIVGVAGEGCARLSSPRWKKRGGDRSADVLLDIETS